MEKFRNLIYTGGNVKQQVMVLYLDVPLKLHEVIGGPWWQDLEYMMALIHRLMLGLRV